MPGDPVLHCTDPAEPLCPACLEVRLTGRSSAALTRGERWGAQVRAAVGGARPWPAFDGKARAIAERKVRDLVGASGTEQESERLAWLCYDSARRAYGAG